MSKQQDFSHYVQKTKDISQNIQFGNVHKRQLKNSKVSGGNRVSTTQKTGLHEVVIKVVIWLTIFLLPIFFTTNTVSILGISKQTLLIGLVGLAFLIWVGRMALRSQIRFRANFIFLPILVFLTMLGLSAIFADYPSQSLWGFFGGETHAFITTVFLVLFFLLFINVIKSKRDIIISLFVFLFSGFLSSTFFVLQLWGKYILPFEITHNAMFNSVGTVYLFSVYAGALFMLSLALTMYARRLPFKILFGILTTGFFVILSIVNFKFVWIVLVIVLALMLGKIIITDNGDSTKRPKGTLILIFLVLSLVMILQRQSFFKKQLPVEIVLKPKASASISWQAMKQSFLFGSGPANYINVYREFRPLNVGRFWATNFNTASSYFLTLSATIGFLGIVSFLFLVMLGGMYLFKGVLFNSQEEDILAIGVGGIWLFLTIMLFVYIANITILFIWWFILAVLVSILAFNPKTELREFSAGETSDKPSLLFSFIFVLIIIGVVVALYSQSQKYLASVHFNKALLSDLQKKSLDTVIDELNKAIMMDINKDLYYRNRSLAYFAKAKQRIDEKGSDLKNPEDTVFIGEMIKNGLNDASRAKELNDKDVDNYFSLIRIYENLIPSMKGAGEKALELGAKAVKLDPNNPIVYQKLATLYVNMADLETLQGKAQNKKEIPDKAKEYLASAKKNAEKAIALKSDYLPARLLLVGIYDREGSNDEAIKEMISSRQIDPVNPNFAFQLGLLYYREDKMDEALTQFVQATQLDPDYANAHYFIGLILDKKGKKDLAIKEFQKVLDLNPGNKLVENIIENLKAGRNALAGLGKSEKVNKETQKQTEEAPAQPTINPNINEDQNIPKEATQLLKDGNTNNQQNSNNQGDNQNNNNSNSSTNTVENTGN